MKALVYRGPRDVRIEEVSDPRIEEPTDVIVKITSTNICGSDLHMYEGRTDVEDGKVLGHENLGEVLETGKAVKRTKRAIPCACRSTSAAGPAKTANAGSPGFV